MKDIKDYLHLYHPQSRLQVKLSTTGEVGTFEGVTSSMIVFVNVNGRIKDEYANYVMPILRPLPDMTEEEAIDIAIIMYGQPDSVKWRMEDKGNYFNVYRKHYSESFTIDKASGDIDRYSKEGDQMELQTTLQHHFITRYLLSKGFDLFGLIEAGLAIDKTTLKP